MGTFFDGKPDFEVGNCQNQLRQSEIIQNSCGRVSTTFANEILEHLRESCKILYNQVKHIFFADPVWVVEDGPPAYLKSFLYELHGPDGKIAAGRQKGEELIAKYGW